MKFILLLLLCISCIILSGCSIGSKSWASAGSCDAFKITPSDIQSGNYAPSIVVGGGAHAMAFQKAYEPGKDYPTIFTYARRKSLWGMFSGDTSSANVSIVYIAGSKETPQETIKILQSFGPIVYPNNKPVPKTTPKE